MAPDFTHSIFDPLSCTGTQWIIDQFKIELSLHSVLICDIHTARFTLDYRPAAMCPCTLIRVPCRPHSEGCGKAHTGCPILLATPQKTESQSWGEFLDSVFFFTLCLGLCFLGVGKKDGTPCTFYRMKPLIGLMGKLKMLGIPWLAPTTCNEIRLVGVDSSIYIARP